MSEGLLKNLSKSSSILVRQTGSKAGLDFTRKLEDVQDQNEVAIDSLIAYHPNSGQNLSGLD